MASFREVMGEVIKVGITAYDAEVIADCITTRKSCSWVNTDQVDDKIIINLKNLITQKNYGVNVTVESLSTRNKFIWEVKVDAPTVPR